MGLFRILEFKKNGAFDQQLRRRTSHFVLSENLAKDVKNIGKFKIFVCEMKHCLTVANISLEFIVSMVRSTLPADPPLAGPSGSFATFNANLEKMVFLAVWRIETAEKRLLAKNMRFCYLSSIEK